MLERTTDNVDLNDPVIIRTEILREVEAVKAVLNPSFPLDAFPSRIQDILREAHDKLNFPLEYIGSSILFAASIAIGSTHRIQIKKGFTESGVVWIALVGRPGINKSHPLKFAIRPILERDIRSYQQYDDDRKRYEELEALTDKQRKELGYDFLPAAPVLKKHLIQDFTPEALAKLHQHNPRGIGIYADELMGWINNFNRYSKGNDQETALQLWSGQPLSIDRKNSGSIFIPRPFVPVIGTIQPSVLAQLGSKSQNNGFMDRILFAAPLTLQKQAWSEQDIDDELINDYHSIINKLFALEPDEENIEQGQVLAFHPAAKKRLFEWQQDNTLSVNRAETDLLRGYYSKLDIYVPRLILLIHLLGRAERNEVGGRPIQLDSVEAGIKLGEYYRRQADIVYENLVHSTGIEKLPLNHRLLYERLPQLFKRKEVLSLLNEVDISSRAFDRMLASRELFIKLRNGEYEKLF